MSPEAAAYTENVIASQGADAATSPLDGAKRRRWQHLENARYQSSVLSLLVEQEFPKILQDTLRRTIIAYLDKIHGFRLRQQSSLS